MKPFLLFSHVNSSILVIQILKYQKRNLTILLFLQSKYLRRGFSTSVKISSNALEMQESPSTSSEVQLGDVICSFSKHLIRFKFERALEYIDDIRKIGITGTLPTFISVLSQVCRQWFHKVSLFYSLDRQSPNTFLSRSRQSYLLEKRFNWKILIRLLKESWISF